MKSCRKILVKFGCSSFLRKRSSKVPRIFDANFTPFFTQTLRSCKCPFSWCFSLCIRLSVIILTPNMTGQRFHRTMEMIPARPRKSKSPSVSTPIKQSTKQGNARGTSEVRRGTSSIHFHCPAPRSSSHIGHGEGGIATQAAL